MEVNGHEHITGAEAILECLIKEGVDTFLAIRAEQYACI